MENIKKEQECKGSWEKTLFCSGLIEADDGTAKGHCLPSERHITELCGWGRLLSRQRVTGKPGHT